MVFEGVRTAEASASSNSGEATSVDEKATGEVSVNDVDTHVCATQDCGKTATLACPTCLKLGLAPIRFCTQECFKSSWPTHKIVHKEVKAARSDEGKLNPMAIPREFVGYTFTGPLRPCQQSPRRYVPESIPQPDYANHPQGISLSEQQDRRTNTSIKVYTPAEIEGVRAACRIGREVLDIAGSAVCVGITTDALDEIVHNATIERGAYPSPLHYRLFPKSVCTSVNEVICHGIPDFRPLENGDIINVDVSVYYNGFHADLNEMFLVGDCDADSVRLVECAYKALGAAIATVRPGTLYREVGDAIGKVAKQFKCSVVTSFIGHGVGELFHTVPDLPHYPNNKAKGTMKAGHIFTIEPMINLGSYRDVMWPDGWTAATIDGKRSAQFEHTMLVTETGCELLTARPGDPCDRLEWNQQKFQR